MMTRRQYLRGAGAAAATATVAAPTVVGRAAASHRSHQPSHVTIDHPAGVLGDYQPRLATYDLQVQPTAVYAWRARSPEADTDAYVYWAEYPWQEGVTSLDSHPGDHEPFYVFADSTSGDIREVVYTGYHWLAARSRSPPTRSGETRPLARAVRRYHHYVLVGHADGAGLELRDLQDVYDQWLANGLEGDLAPGVVVNPWRMRSRESWWRRGVAGVSVIETVWQAMLAAGVAGADDSDLSGGLL